MINGLGLFASLAGPEAATPPAPAEDPALFAAALVAALGLQQPKPIVEPVQGSVADVALEESEEEASEGEVPPGVVATTDPVPESQDPTAVAARVTPDADAVAENDTLGQVRNSVSGKNLNVVSDEPARPTPVKQGKGEAKAASEPVAPQPKTSSHAAPAKRNGPITLPADLVMPGQEVPVAAASVQAPICVIPKPMDPAASSDAVDAHPAGAGPTDEKRAARSRQADEPAIDQSTPNPSMPATSVLAPVAQVMAPVGKQAPTTDVSDSSTRETTTDPAGTAPRIDLPVKRGEGMPPRSAAVERLVAEYNPPPQSVEERTARAIAQNTSLGRQLAELLGEADITEFKVQLGQRPARANGADAPVIPPAPAKQPGDAAVVWQRALPSAAGDTISGQMLPSPAPRGVKAQLSVDGTIAHEASEPVVSQKPDGGSVTIAAVNSRPEIVRMVANASRAMAPNLTETEGKSAAAKAPAPSMTTSLPVDRQEIPAPSRREQAADRDDRDRRAGRDAAASDAAPATSAYVANNSTANTSRETTVEPRDTREARNLPSHGSTDQKAAGSADRVTLQVADDEGRQTRIRVSVTGNQIRAVITPPDSASARQLEQRMDQLHETLVRQGFADPKLVVRVAQDAAADAAVVAGSAQGSQEGRSTVPAGKDQPAGEQRQGRGQREQDRGDGHRHPQGHSRERDPRDRRR